METNYQKYIDLLNQQLHVLSRATDDDSDDNDDSNDDDRNNNDTIINDIMLSGIFDVLEPTKYTILREKIIDVNPSYRTKIKSVPITVDNCNDVELLRKKGIQNHNMLLLEKAYNMGDILSGINMTRYLKTKDQRIEALLNMQKKYSNNQDIEKELLIVHQMRRTINHLAGTGLPQDILQNMIPCDLQRKITGFDHENEICFVEEIPKSQSQ